MTEERARSAPRSAASGVAAARRGAAASGAAAARRSPARGTAAAPRAAAASGESPARRAAAASGESPARRAAAGHGRPGRPRHGSTRERIQAVALELFAEQGYDKTSLREIAERLGVTKAALYYHFQSKEDIVRSFTSEYRAELEEIIAWGSQQPRTAESRAAILGRYAAIVSGRLAIIRFMEQNQAALHSLLRDGEHPRKMFSEQFRQLRELVIPPDATLRERIRASLALVSIGIGCMLYQAEAASPDELHDTVLDIACELADAEPVSPPPARS